MNKRMQPSCLLKEICCLHTIRLLTSRCVSTSLFSGAAAETRFNMNSDASLFTGPENMHPTAKLLLVVNKCHRCVLFWSNTAAFREQTGGSFLKKRCQNPSGGSGELGLGR